MLFGFTYLKNKLEHGVYSTKHSNHRNGHRASYETFTDSGLAGVGCAAAGALRR